MKTLNFKKLYALLILAIVFIAKTQAQVVYTDVNPDTIVTSSNLDINSDGINDYAFSSVTTFPCTGNCSGPTQPYWHKYFDQLQSNSLLVISTSNHNPRVLSVNEIITSSSAIWENTLSHQLIYRAAGCGMGNACYITPVAGTWNNVANKFIGLKFSINGQNHYGWVRISVSGLTVTLQDYAYNSIPNQPILAGETICAIPTVSLTASGSLSFCAGDSVTLTANGTGYLYQWKKNGANISGATHQTYVAKIAGIYKCKVTNSCGVKTSGGKTVTVNCRLENEIITDITEHLTIYPNPSTSFVTVKIPTDDEGEISVTNLYGQIIYSEKVSAEQAQIDVSKFSAGVYFVRWSSGENSETKMFSVVK